MTTVLHTGLTSKKGLFALLATVLLFAAFSVVGCSRQSVTAPRIEAEDVSAITITAEGYDRMIAIDLDEEQRAEWIRRLVEAYRSSPADPGDGEVTSIAVMSVKLEVGLGRDVLLAWLGGPPPASRVAYQGDDYYVTGDQPLNRELQALYEEVVVPRGAAISSWEVRSVDSPAPVHEPPFLIGETLAWIGYGEDSESAVYLHDLETGETRTINTPSYQAEDLVAAGNRLAWVGVGIEIDPSGEFQRERNVVFLYDVATDELRRFEEGFASAVWLDGRFLVWQAADVPLIRGLMDCADFAHPDSPRPDQIHAYVHDLETGETSTMDPFNHPRVALGGGLLAAPQRESEGGGILLTDLVTREERMLEAEDGVEGLSVAGGLVAWCDREGRLFVHEWEADDMVALDAPGGRAFDPVVADGRVAARTGPGPEPIGVTVWDPAGRQLFTWDEPPASGRNSLYDFDGDLLAWVVPGPRQDRLLTFDLVSGGESAAAVETMVGSDLRIAGERIIWVTSELGGGPADGLPPLRYTIHVAEPVRGG